MRVSKTSVIIPYYNAEETIKLCLSSLCLQSVRPEEIILVDNGSSDKSRCVAESFANTPYQARVISTECYKAGPSSARNKGASLATGDWLLFTDSDCVPSSTWISDYLVHLSDEAIAAVAGAIKPYPPANVVQKTLSLFTLPQNQQEMVHHRANIGEGLYPAANLAIRRDVFNLVSGFNESLFYGEDHDLCFRIYRAGYKIKAVRDATVEHIHRRSVRQLVRQSFGFGTAHPYELRHFTAGAIIFASPVFDIQKSWPGKFLWMDLNQADKKFLATLLLGWVWWPLFSFSLLYLFYLSVFVFRKAKRGSFKMTLLESSIVAALLTLKSFALSAGRILYSFKHKVICI